jgi:hypothetical protein
MALTQSSDQPRATIKTSMAEAHLVQPERILRLLLELHGTLATPRARRPVVGAAEALVRLELAGVDVRTLCGAAMFLEGQQQQASGVSRSEPARSSGGQRCS